MPQQIAAVPGTHDVLPEASAAWEWLLDTHRRVASSFGYVLVEAPIFEHTELFERGVGTGTDVVEKEMYTFSDRGGRSLTLRPEGTAGVVRAALGARPALTRRPLRLRYAGPMFRAERPQRGRFRHFSQVGIECIGARAAELDVEVIECAALFLDALGITGVRVGVNSLGDAEDRVRFRAALVGYYTPHVDELCEDCRRRLTVNPLRLLDCKRDAGLATAAPRMHDSLSEASRQYFAEVLDGLGAAAIEHHVDDRLVRGLDYYAHTTFELWHPALSGAQNALAGGGRYDGLAEELGFPATPGVGYAMGVERLLLVAGEQGSLPPSAAHCDAVVLPLAASQATAAADAARSLRAGGTATVLDASPRRLGARLGAADALGARVAVIIGEDELAAGTATLRDLAARQDRTVRLDQLPSAIQTMLAETGETGEH